MCLMKVEFRARFRFLNKVIGELLLRNRPLCPAELWGAEQVTPQIVKPPSQERMPIISYRAMKRKSQSLILMP